MLMTWPFGPPPRYLLWRPHTELWFDWNAGLSSDVFPFQQMWGPFVGGFHQANFQLHLFIQLSTSIPYPLFTGSLLTALFLFLHMYFCWRPTSLCLEAFRCFSACSWSPSKEPLSLLYKGFLWPVFIYALSEWFLFLSDTKLQRLHRAPSRPFTGCLSTSPIFLI